MRRSPPAAPLLAASVVLLLLAPTVVESEEEAEAGAVVALGADSFDGFLAATERALVEFYAPWCGHCKALEPEYNRAASEMREENMATRLAKVDATAEKDLAQKYDVSGYPTLLYFVKGKEPAKYEGGRTAPEIKAWLAKRELPAVVVLEGEKAKTYLADEAAFDDKSPDSAVPAGTKDGHFRVVAKVVKKSARAKAFQSAAEGTLANIESLPLSLEAVHLPKGADPKGAETSLTMWRAHFEEPDARRLVYTGKWTEAAIAKWVRSNIYRTVGKKFDDFYTADAAQEIGRDGSVVVVLDDGTEEEEDEVKLRPAAMKALLPLAIAEPRWLFAAVSLDALDEAGLQKLSLTRSSRSTAIVLKGTKKYRLAPDGDDAVTSAGSVEALLEAVKAGKARPYYKSAPAPAQATDSDGVTVLVGETFDKYVMDSKKDVFVEFYAPWCGHCKKLSPVWADLAKKAQNDGWSDRGVVIAKMDSTENECEEEIGGYPKLVLYPAVKSDKKFKSKLEYSGQREFEPLVDFVLESARNLEGLDESVGKKDKQYTSIIDRERAKKKAKKEL